MLQMLHCVGPGRLTCCGLIDIEPCENASKVVLAWRLRVAGQFAGARQGVCPVSSADCRLPIASRPTARQLAETYAPLIERRFGHSIR